ncbi:type II toxin-antitoxin system HicA family toxin [Streptomyces finlayi]|uniref:Type II toxin-antitoxin system HicA family toxin n=1 Tax=Streptomyces finlayi TaxID=67296 RepID=A0A7G7BQC1_9ACTN|nr:type II toxin-antitoxin system HicA family toxin [Streptomyces finlayi]QNE77536.1 type II toxin-antitoxin system HicA family toxin [Streptomyces finlayi]
MKRRDLMKRLKQIAAEKEVDFTGPEGSGRGRHETYKIGAVKVHVPRHSEIAEGTAASIIRTAEGA